MPRLAAVAVAIAVSLAALAARAQTRDPVLAEALFREGRLAIESGDLTKACARFGQSYRLDPAPGTLLNLASCEEKLGRLASAWEHYHALVDTLAPNDDRRDLAKSHADSVAARVPRLKISLAPKAPPGARVLRDGAPVDPAALGVSVPIDPGAHVLVVQAPDCADKQTKVDLAVGEQKAIVLEAGAPLPPVVTPPPPPPPRLLSGRRLLALAVVGGGVAVAAAGGVVGGVALATNGNANRYCTGNVCTDPRGVTLHETAKTEAIVADVLFGTAVVAVAAGAVLWLTAKHPRAASAYVAPGLGGVWLGGEF